MSNPLFPRAMDALRRAALSEFRSTLLGQTVNAMRRASARGSSADLAILQRAVQQYARDARGGMGGAASRSELGRMVQQYARGGFKQKLADSIFSALGPVGDILQGLLRPRGRQMADLNRELETAANLLEMFGYRIQRPGQTSPPRPQITHPSPVPAAAPPVFNAQDAARQLEELGFTITPPPADQSQPHPRAEKPGSQPGQGRGQVQVPVGGQKILVSPDDPILTGEMIPVTSSNVHSIGYIWNAKKPQSGTLKVRFLDNRGGKRTGAGPLYFYYDCPPQMFRAFQQASSKGKWVWDNLRIRGTVSGHQKRYALAGLASSGYVPRKATRLGNEEWYLPRTVKGQNGREYRSRLKAQMVRRLDDAKPNRGGPNRAGPNRGR